jgi:DNA modification methylase
MIKPYYSDKYVQIFLGDCREILPQLDVRVDLVLTDPPYVGMDSKTTIMPIGGVGKHYKVTKTIGDIWDADFDWINLVKPKVSLGMMVFCSYHAVSLIPELVGTKPIALITWHKRNAPPARLNVPHFTTEFIWAFRLATGLKWENLETLYDIPKLATGCMASKERFIDADGMAIHPTQKPESLIMELLRVDAQTILDPFLGSGTTCYCAKKLNRYSIGIEIEERYAEIAANRCRQNVMELNI